MAEGHSLSSLEVALLPCDVPTPLTGIPEQVVRTEVRITTTQNGPAVVSWTVRREPSGTLLAHEMYPPLAHQDLEEYLLVLVREAMRALGTLHDWEPFPD